MYNFLMFPNFKIMAVTLSYDDNTWHDKKLIDILKRYNLKCTFNVNSGCFATEENKGKWRLTKDEALSLYNDSDYEVAAHGLKHISLTNFKDTNVCYELLNDKENLENMFGKIVKGLAYANGDYDERVEDLVKKCGFKYARTTKSTYTFDLPTNFTMLNPTCRHTESCLMELVNKFLENKDSTYIWANKPKLFYLWGHSFEFERDDNYSVMEEFGKLVGNRNDIWYATNGEICDYVEAYNRLEYSIDGSIIYNPTNIDIYLYYYGDKVLVKSGEQLTKK